MTPAERQRRKARRAGKKFRAEHPPTPRQDPMRSGVEFLVAQHKTSGHVATANGPTRLDQNRHSLAGSRVA